MKSAAVIKKILSGNPSVTEDGSALGTVVKARSKGATWTFHCEGMHNVDSNIVPYVINIEAVYRSTYPDFTTKQRDHYRKIHSLLYKRGAICKLGHTYDSSDTYNKSVGKISENIMFKLTYKSNPSFMRPCMQSMGILWAGPEYAAGPGAAIATYRLRDMATAESIIDKMIKLD
jgi:hypothetical protein